MKDLLRKIQAGWDRGWQWTRAQWLRFRKRAIAILIALGLISSPLLFADDVNLAWTNAQFYEDGTPMPQSDIDHTTLYKQSFALGTDLSTQPRVYAELVQVPPTVTSYIDADQPNGIHCYVGTHTTKNGEESQYSGESCKTIDVRIPGTIQGLRAT